MKNRIFVWLLAACAGIQLLSAQEITRFQPLHEEMVQRYIREYKINQAVKNTVFKTTVTPQWLDEKGLFWYRNILKDSVEEYILVNPENGKKQPLFDAARLAKGLEKEGVSIDPLRPGIKDVSLKDNQLGFVVKGKKISCNLKKYTCRLIKDTLADDAGNQRRRRDWAFPAGAVSPDKKWEAYLEKGNLFIRSGKEANPVQLTDDANQESYYSSIYWSPDGKYLVGYSIKPVYDDSVHYVLTSEKGTRGVLQSRPYKQPGDPWTIYTLYIFDIARQKAIRVNADSIDFLYAPVPHWRVEDARYFTYEKMERGHQRFRIIEVDAQANATRNVVDEETNSFIYERRNYTYYLKNASRMIRSSEKDGWRHLYLVDLVTGEEQPITKGEWVVREIDFVDEAAQQVWFRASGMNGGEDPYNIHYYRIGLDGEGLVSLTPEKGNHTVHFSADRSYFTDTYSEVNTPPQTKLKRSVDGKEILLLEEADITDYLKTGVRPPEVFVAKGRDGKTDIWGIVHKPSDFDPYKKYPVLENIYAGPHDSFVPKNFTSFSEMQSLAELGFIVVMIDGMGTANRSKTFHDVCWQNLADAGFPDRILWIKALAEKYPYIDTTRVGLYGTSAGGQSTLGALLFHPEFYKAGVSACGCHDNRVDKQWWNEQWMGYPVGPHYAAQSNVTNAHKLKGNLLLIVGEADTNVPPESTYRVADALIKAGKNFDFLAVPGMGHSDGGPYGRAKKRDFFVQHLLGVTPPNRNAGELERFDETGRERWSFD